MVLPGAASSRESKAHTRILTRKSGVAGFGWQGGADCSPSAVPLLLPSPSGRWMSRLPVDGDLEALGGERAQRGERGGLAGWEGGREAGLLCDDVVSGPVGFGQAGPWQGRGGSAESTQASKRRERCAQRPGSPSVCVGEQQATLFGQKFQMQNGESRADNTAKRDNFPTSFIQMLRSLPECRKRAFQYSFL